MIADGAGDRLGCGADEADGAEKLVGLHLPKHSDAADGVAHLAGHVMDRRGDGAQADLILAVFHSVALLADVGQLRRELLRRGERVRREGLELGVRENAAALRRRAVGKEKLALRRTIDRKPCADLGHDAKTRAGLLLCQRYDCCTVKNRQEYTLAKFSADTLHMRPCNRTDIP